MKTEAYKKRQKKKKKKHAPAAGASWEQRVNLKPRWETGKCWSDHRKSILSSSDFRANNLWQKTNEQKNPINVTNYNCRNESRINRPQLNVRLRKATRKHKDPVELWWSYDWTVLSRSFVISISKKKRRRKKSKPRRKVKRVQGFPGGLYAIGSISGVGLSLHENLG